MAPAVDMAKLQRYLGLWRAYKALQAAHADQPCPARKLAVETAKTGIGAWYRKLTQTERRLAYAMQRAEGTRS